MYKLHTDKNTQTHKHKHTNRQTHKHTNTQTHKHTNTQTYKHTNIQTDKQTNRQTDKQTNRQTHTQVVFSWNGVSPSQVSIPSHGLMMWMTTVSQYESQVWGTDGILVRPAPPPLRSLWPTRSDHLEFLGKDGPMMWLLSWVCLGKSLINRY